MRRRIFTALTSVLLCTAVATAGHAATGDVPAGIASSKAKQAYSQYTTAIRDERVGWEERVQLLRQRGALLSNHFLLDAALTDFQQAASLAPHYSMTHLDVATVLTKMGRFPEAYQSFREGFQANPANLVLFMTRGMTHFNDGKFKKAARDFRRHLAHNPKDGYRMLWLALAVDRKGGDGRPELRENAKTLDRKVWPGPLIDMYLGERTPQAVLSAASSGRSLGAKERLCEAYFFVAQWHLNQGNETMAREYFQKTVDTKVLGFMEYASARLALKQ